MTERLVSPEEQAEEVQVRTTLRPLLLNEFVGQAALKKNLSIFIQAAKNGSMSMSFC